MGNIGPFVSWMEGELLWSEWEGDENEPAGRQSVRRTEDGSLENVFFQTADDGHWVEAGHLTLTGQPSSYRRASGRT